MSGAKSLVGKDCCVMQAGEALVSPSTGWCCHRPWHWAGISQDAGPGATPSPLVLRLSVGLETIYQESADLGLVPLL